MEYSTRDFVEFRVTGYYANSNKKFKTISTNSWWHAMGINLWKGRVWGVFKDGKRKLLKTVY